MNDVCQIFHSKTAIPRHCRVIDTLHDIYAYGVEPMTNDELRITAERNQRPIIVHLAADESIRSVLEVASAYRGISSSCTSAGLTRVVTYDTEPGRAGVLLETFESTTTGLQIVRKDHIDLGYHVLRVYDMGCAAWQNGEVLVIVALVADQMGRCQELFFRFQLLNEVRPLGILELPSQYNELRSLSLHAEGEALYMIACRRFWLKNEVFLFSIEPEVSLIGQREFTCRGADFQQVGTRIDARGCLSIAALHRQRRDIDGIRYNVDWF